MAKDSSDRQESCDLTAMRFRSETFTVISRDIAKFATAIGARNPIYFNPAAARRHGYSDVIAPPSFYTALGLARGRVRQRIDLGADGLPKAEPFSGLRAMAGETEVRMRRPIVAGDLIKVSQRVVDVKEREGRSGRIRFITYERRYVRHDRTTVAVERFVRLAR